MFRVGDRKRDAVQIFYFVIPDVETGLGDENGV